MPAAVWPMPARTSDGETVIRCVLSERGLASMRFCADVFAKFPTAPATLETIFFAAPKSADPNDGAAGCALLRRTEGDGAEEADEEGEDEKSGELIEPP